MIQGILKALAGQGGAAFFKGVTDGYNEDVKAKQLQEYELAKEIANKEPEPDTTRTLFKVTKGPAVGTVVTINNPLKEEGYADAGARNAEALQRIFKKTAQPGDKIDWKNMNHKGLANKVKQGNPLPTITNWTEYLHQYEDMDAINQLISTSSVPANALYNLSKGDTGGTEIPMINYPINNRFWETVITQFQNNAGRAIYRTKSNFIKSMSDKTKNTLDLVFVAPEGDEVGTVGSVKMSDVIKDVNVLNPTNSNEVKQASAEQMYDFIYEYGRNKGFTRTATSQEQLRERVLGDILKMSTTGKSNDVEVGKFNAKKFMQHAMVMNQIFSEGYFSVTEGQLQTFNNYLENHMGDVVDNPMLIIEILGTAFTKNPSLNDLAYRKDVEGFNNFVKNVLQIKDIGSFRKAMENVTKPLDRVGRMLTDLEKMPKGQVRPLGGAASLGSFFGAIKDFPKMMSSIFGMEELSGGRGSETFQKTMNILDSSKTETANLKEDHDVLYNNMTTAQKQLSDNPEDEKKINLARLAVMEYNTYLLAFEMAAAVQGGGDSRTISDKDVRIMQKAIMLRFFTSPKAFKGVLTQIQKDLNKMRNNAKLFRNVLLSGNVQSAKGLGVFERAGLGDKYFTTLAGNYYNDAMAEYKPEMAGDVGFNPEAVYRLEPGTTLENTNRIVDETREQNLNTFMASNENIGSIKYNIGPAGSKRVPSSFQEVISDMTSNINNIVGFQNQVAFLYGDGGRGYLKQIEKIAKLNEGVTGGTRDFIQQVFSPEITHVFNEVIKMNEDAGYQPQPLQ